jgi:hypothetical protein
LFVNAEPCADKHASPFICPRTGRGECRWREPCGLCAKRSVGKFALAYAEQTQRDHEALDKARRSGRIQVASERVVK